MGDGVGKIVSWVEFLSESGVEFAVVDGAANLEQEICTASRPAHLLRFVHPTVHQEIGCPFGDGGSDPQSRSMSGGIIDQPVALAGEITI